ncbi:MULTISPECIES: pyruvate, phosphate dikinase [Rhodococcus]|uniref:Pyruvate phosphate dikinase n=1 Tax=Rhodococcus opacus RKJ300 = JCM 13270 TaxID=1165867 RepID=I0WNU1_RHOOP|nr:MULTISPECIES: pyruvate, phosphate dikinase [Rhodococcus]EID78057.1 pyruvate phosphate dikinase [Rhodococcus opacus RKJ300 = JCM 13270]QQZ19568.1 pyruvate, phosphate dikinase [Rhodococcus sp. 21391]
MSTVTSFRWLVIPDETATEPSRDLVGGKAWSLWRMRSLGLRVPPAFVVTTEACAAYFAEGGLPDGLADELVTGIRLLEKQLGRTFGGTERPLLVSVRSGAAISMPGMMDTILDLGCNDAVEAALAAESGDPDFAAEVHRRFTGFYGRLVLGCTDDLEDLPDTASVRAAIAGDVDEMVPADPWEQLRAAVAAVFQSSRSRRAVAYRKHYGIPDDLGTAVTVQAMVFGNLDDDSGTGVLFTRNPVDGTREPYGEYLQRGQGEDVVSGRVTPKPLTDLHERWPTVHTELLEAADRLDREGKDAQDIEFTVQSGELFLLQSRPAKRTARAAVRIAVELVDEGVIEPAEALSRVTADQIRTLLRPEIAAGAADSAEVLVSGVAASPGVATGIVVDTPEAAQANPGCILVRKSTSPDDVHGMIAAAAVVTEQGGATSHAAVVSRALDTPCVVGCGTGTVESLVGRTVTVDATTGRVYAGELPTSAVDESKDEDLRRLTEWAEGATSLQVGIDVAVEPVFDADALPAEELGEQLPDIPRGTKTVRGAVFCAPDGVRAAIDAGVDAIVTAHRLPVLLATIAHHRRTS